MDMAVMAPVVIVSPTHCTALHCTALHGTALHCTALHCTALHSDTYKSLIGPTVFVHEKMAMDARLDNTQLFRGHLDWIKRRFGSILANVLNAGLNAVLVLFWPML
jgi:hypothetical protein